ncbi:MAG: hypothetical protein PHV99_01635 [Candidatus Pacebacteria bacterium]|nr:hypothetical protein [Candidatus Paceibacterota bacterium]
MIFAVPGADIEWVDVVSHANGSQVFVAMHLSNANVQVVCEALRQAQLSDDNFRNEYARENNVRNEALDTAE